MVDSIYTEIYNNPEFSEERRNTPMNADNIKFSAWDTAASPFSDRYSKFGSAYEQTAVAGVAAKAAIGIYDWAVDSRVHTPEEFASVDMKVDEPMTMTEAMYLQGRKERQQLDSYIQGNLKEEFGDTVVPFAASMIGDLSGNAPLYYTGGVVAGAAIGAVAPMVLGAARSARVAQFFGKNIATRALRSGSIEAVGAAIVENPADWAVRTQLYGEEYTVGDGLENIAYSFLGGLVLSPLGEAFQKIQKASVDAAAKGKQANNTPREVVDKLQYGDKEGATRPISFEGPVYGAHATTTRVLGIDSQKTFGSTFGREGIVVTTSEEISKRASKNNRLDIHGQQLAFNLAEVKLLDGDIVIPKDIEVKLYQELKKRVGPDEASKILSESRNKSETVKELAHRLNKVALETNNKKAAEALNNTVSKMGFEGYSFLHRNSVGKPVGGEGASAVHLFDKKKLGKPDIRDLSSPDKADPRIEGDTFEETIKTDQDYYDSPESEIFYDKESYTRLDSTPISYGEKPNYDLKEFDSELEEILKDIDITNADIVTDIFKEAGAKAERVESDFDLSKIYDVLDNMAKDKSIIFHGGTAPSIEKYIARGTTDSGYYGVGLMGSPSSLSYTSSYRKHKDGSILGKVLGFKIKDGVKVYTVGIDGGKDLKTYTRFIDKYEKKMDSLDLSDVTKSRIQEALTQYREHIAKIPYINYEESFFRNPLNILLDVRPKTFQTGRNVHPRDIRKEIPAEDHAKLDELQEYKSLELLKDSFKSDALVNKRGDEVVIWGREGFEDLVDEVKLPNLDEAAQVIGGTLEKMRQDPKLTANIEMAIEIRQRLDELKNEPKPEEIRQASKESVFCDRG